MKESGKQYGPVMGAFLVVTIWGSGFVIQKAALAEFNVLCFNFVRFLSMAVLGWVVLYVQSFFQGRPHPNPAPGRLPRLKRADWPQIILSGVLGYSLYIQLSTLGLNITTAFSNTLLIATAPLFTALLLWIRKLEVITPGQCMAMLLAVAGVFVFLADKIESGLRASSLGDLLCLAAAFFYAAYMVTNKPLLARYPAPVLTAYSLTIGAIPVLLISLPGLFTQDWSRITLAGWLAMAWMVVGPVYFAWTLWSWVSARMGVARTAVYLYLVPIIGGVVSWWWLGEAFGPVKIGGAVLILASLLLVRYLAYQKPAPAPAPAPEAAATGTAPAPR